MLVGKWLEKMENQLKEKTIKHFLCIVYNDFCIQKA